MSSIEKTITPVLEQNESIVEPILDSNNDVIITKTNMEENMNDIEQIQSKYAPDAIFIDKKEIVKNEIVNEKPLQLFDKMIKLYYDSKPYENKIAELEVRFGTKGIKPLNKNDYDNVIKKLKSSGFQCDNVNGEYSLRIQSLFLDKNGMFGESAIRTEIYGLNKIQAYCKNDSLTEVRKNGFNSLRFTKKGSVYKDNKRVLPVNFDDFNYRISLQNEEKVQQGLQTYIIQSWKESKKNFRYMNRVTFTHPDYPVKVDLSIVKYGDMDVQNTEYYKKMKWVWTAKESNVFSNPETYEIEIEVDHDKIGPGTKFNSPESLMGFDSIRKIIKLVVCGLQGTNYPCSYPEQKNVLDTYMKLLGHDFNPKRRTENKHFIGPNSITLQMENVASIESDSLITNIRKDYTVTEKADGDRHLMYVNNEGKIFLINTNMKVIFTGAVTHNKETYNSLLDGELISYDKSKQFINLYAAFDIYYYKQDDVRALSFMPTEKDPTKSRLLLLKDFMKTLNPVEIGTNKNTKTDTIKAALEAAGSITSPMRFVSKEFYPLNNNDTIFAACNNILSKIKEGLFEYETDGLIFTPAYYGVGSNKIGIAGPKTKITWEKSFKWKPPKYNTIDFLVTTVKKNGDELVKPLFEEGVNVDLNTQLSEYKVIQLRCSYNQRTHGYVNPCQYLIDDKLPEYKNKYEDNEDYDNETKPVLFYPTEPYDSEAGTCNIMLRRDDNNVNQMFTEENDVFTDNMIVEFSYDLDREKGWNWIPLRVRYDKTTELLQGKKNFGNAYHVANNNWKSIHNPITEDMICTGLNIPDIMVNEDKYYNNSARMFKTKNMKDFHNLFVKKLLIKSVSKKGDTLIDFACGKAGDLPKWVSAQLSFVFGIDIHKDNLENNKDGACVRFLEMRKKEQRVPNALFVNGNSSFNIRNGEAMLNDKAKQITKAIFGTEVKNEEKLGKGVFKQYAKGEKGFNVSSCQFAVHYFLENPTTLKGFMRNIAECTQKDGYFIGTAYDGKQIFNLLRDKKNGESVQIVEDGQKVWEVTKGYDSTEFEADSSSIGYKIDVYQDSINKTFSEYLINFEYLDRIFGIYGFKLVDRDEAQSLGLPEGSGLFQELYNQMLLEIQKNRYIAKDFGNAVNMSDYEKKISFLNRYFVYKKIRDVNAEKIDIELGEYKQESVIGIVIKEDQEKEEKEEKKIKPKIRKLTRKLVLVAETVVPETVVPETVVLETVVPETVVAESVLPETLVEEVGRKIKGKPKKLKRIVIHEE